MHKSRVIPLAIAFALAVGGCARGSDDHVAAPPKPKDPTEYTKVERTWLEKLGAWRFSMDSALRTILVANGDAEAEALLRQGDPAVVNDIRTALEVLRGCSSTFRTQVGAAPTERMRQAAEATTAACPDFQRGADADLHALDESTPELLDAGDGFIELGAESLWTANEQALRLSEGRELPEVEGAIEASHRDPRFGRIAGALADNLATVPEVRCWSEEDWPGVLEELSAYAGKPPPFEVAGFASPDLVRIHLAPAVCEELVELAYGTPPDEPTLELAAAVETLAHEAMHVAWVDDEAAAECYALQYAARTAILLGAERTYANDLARLFWEDVYPDAPPEYRSAECADGRTLDVNPRTSAWP